MERELVIVLDFGGQYNQLIARRVRECSASLYPWAGQDPGDEPEGDYFYGRPQQRVR